MGAPIGQTCPDIDRVITSINKAIRFADDARDQFGKDHECDDWFYDIKWELDGLEKELEKLRRANSELREWGESLEEEVNELKSQSV